jgi:hypothetical protein
MTVQTDQTLEAYCQCAEAMGSAASAALIATVQRAARLQRASDDIAADALPHVFIAVHRNGVAPEAAALQVIRSKQRTAMARDAGDDVALDALQPWQRDALQVAAESARDTVARAYGGGSYAPRLTLAEALQAAPKGSGSLLRLILSDALQRAPKREYGKCHYVPLRVSTVAELMGEDRPHTRTASNAMRAIACKAYGQVEALRQTDQTAGALAKRAYLYVTRDRSADFGQAVWQYDARPAGVDYALYRPSKAVTPDLQDIGTLSGSARPFQRVTGHKANTGSKGRKGSAAGQPTMGTPHGVGGAYTPTQRDTAATVKAARDNRTLEAADIAAVISEARKHGAVCKRWQATAGALPLTTVSGSMAAGVTCNCGAGAALVVTLICTAGKGSDYVLAHALPVCSAPESGVCRCGIHAGILTDDGRHQRRAGKAARSMV